MKKQFHLAPFCAVMFGIAASGEVVPPPDAERTLRLAASAAGGIFYGLDGGWVKNQTFVTVERSDRELIVRLRAFFPRRKAIRRAGNPAEPLSLFTGEHTELLLVPGTDQRVYYHFAVNPDNLIYTAKRRDASWDSDAIRISAAVNDDCWDSEYRIPFAALAVPPPADGAVWRINFCRLSAAIDEESVWSSWNHSGSYHDISTMGALIFDRRSEDETFPPIRELTMSDTQLRLHPVDDFGWEIEVKTDEVPWTREIAPSGAMTFTRPRPPRFRRLKSDAMISLQLTSPGGRVSKLRSSVRPEARDILLPDQFYCSGDRISCRIDGRDGTLRMLDTAGREVRRYPVRDGAADVEMRGLPAGSYILEYDNGAVRTTRTVIRCGNLPPLSLPDGKLTCGPDGFSRGSQPFFLLGLAEEPDAERFPFAPEFTFGQCRGLTRNAARLGSVPGGRIIRVVHLSRLLHERGRQEADFEEFFRNLTVDPECIYRLEYEAGLALYFGESPDAMTPCADQPGWYRQLGATAKRLAPEILTSIHLDSQSQLAEYAAAADVLEFSDWTASFAEDDMMRHIRGALFRVRRAVPDKPIVFWLGGSIPDGRRRTPEELRAGIYLSLLAGCAGNIIHTGHGNIPAERTRMWSFLCGISREIAEFYPRFIRGEPIDYPLPADFAGRAVRLPDGTVMLVVVNLRDGENRLETPAGPRIFTPYEPSLLLFPGTEVKQEKRTALLSF